MRINWHVVDDEYSGKCYHGWRKLWWTQLYQWIKTFHNLRHEYKYEWNLPADIQISGVMQRWGVQRTFVLLRFSARYWIWVITELGNLISSVSPLHSDSPLWLPMLFSRLLSVWRLWPDFKMSNIIQYGSTNRVKTIWTGLVIQNCREPWETFVKNAKASIVW